MPVKPIPDGYHTVTPYLVVQGADRFIEFAKKAFGAQELNRMAAPDGSVMHAEVKIGDSILMIGGANEKYPARPANLYFYVNDADSIYRRAVQAGATSTMALADQFWGDRAGGVKDPFGNEWWIATHKEDISPEEMRKRSEEFFKQATR